MVTSMFLRLCSRAPRMVMLRLSLVFGRSGIGTLRTEMRPPLRLSAAAAEWLCVFRNVGRTEAVCQPVRWIVHAIHRCKAKGRRNRRPPQPDVPASRRGRRFVRSEAVVHADADHVGLVGDLGVRTAAAGRRVAGDVAEIGVEVFELRRPVRHERPFDAGAGDPAELGLVDAAAILRRRLDVADRRAARDVGQEAIPGVADAAAAGGQPGVLGLAAIAGAGRTRAAARARAVGPACVDIALETEHEVAGLHVVTERAADLVFLHVVADVAANRVIPVAMAPGVAAVDTDVETRPAESRRGNVDRRFVGGPRQIGRERGRGPGCGHQTGDRQESETLHASDLLWSLRPKNNSHWWRTLYLVDDSNCGIYATAVLN